MEGPTVPRSRKSKHKLSSTLTSFVKSQYPHTNPSTGRRELKVEARDKFQGQVQAGLPSDVADAKSRIRPHSTGAATPARNTGRASSSPEAVNEPLVEDFQDRYVSRTSYSLHAESRTHLPQVMSSPERENAPNAPDSSDSDDDGGPTPGASRDFAKTEVYVPTRTSSRGTRGSRQSRRPAVSRKPSGASVPDTPGTTGDRGWGPGDRSSADSVFSQDTSATSMHTLPPLQTKGPDNSDAQLLEPVLEDDPRSFDLVAPPQEGASVGLYALERRAEQMFSQEHLKTIFDDPKLLLRFTGFLNSHRPQSIPLLIYYLDSLKALRAIRYANAIAEALDPIRGHKFTEQVANPTSNSALEEKANRAFEILVREDLPAYIAHVWIQVVSTSIQRRITGTLAPHLREASEGLAEVFCLTDPSRNDNPIVFASEEFARTTQYGMSYTIGRNCRFLQGPKTNPNSVRRLAQACSAGKELTEVFVNYRRDGSPFMNLLMIAPLMDSRGNIRYFIGAQVDVSGLIKDCSDLDGLARLVEKERDPETAAREEETNKKDEFQELSEMLNGAELETVRKHGGRMHKEYVEDSDADSVVSHGRPRLVLKDPSQDLLDQQQSGSMTSSLSSTNNSREKLNGRLEGVYQHYLLVRPAPSLRILFTSPSLRVPGILQSPFLNRIGGSSRVRSDLAAALGEGRGVTAKIRWLTRADEDGEGDGRPRWIHCTPLLGHSGAVGVWMIVLVDEPDSKDYITAKRRFREAPPVAAQIRGRDLDASAVARSSRERRHMYAYDKEHERRGGGGAAARGGEMEYFPSSSRTNDRQNLGDRTEPRSRPVSGSAASARGAREAANHTDTSDFEFDIKTPGPESKAGPMY